jgi:hypothetical protein
MPIRYYVVPLSPPHPSFSLPYYICAIHIIVLTFPPSLNTWHYTSILKSVLNTCFSYSPCQVHSLVSLVSRLFSYKIYCEPYPLLSTLRYARSVGLPRTSDRPVAQASTCNNTQLTSDRHPCLRRDSNP